MEKQSKFKKSILGVALATVIILLVPLVAMQFTNEVDWSVFDFIIMGALGFGTGLAYVLISRFSSNIVYRTAIGLAIGTTFFMIWANLAVGLIGAGPNPGNLMYMAVVAVVIIGSILSHFSPGGMERAMYATALALMLLAVIALSANMNEYPGSSVTEIIGVNGFFAMLFVISGILFRHVAQNNPPMTEKSKG
jgi:hypothetical protein